jgi:hypothetical protein
VCDPLPYLVKPYARNLYGPIRLGLALQMFKCYYLVYKAKGLFLNNIKHFKNHIKIVHSIKLKDLKYIS